MICDMKTAVITGVSGGMGLATAKKLLQEGWVVFGLDIREPEGATMPEGLREPKKFDAQSINVVPEDDSMSGFCFIKTDLTSMESVEQASFSVRTQMIKKNSANINQIQHLQKAGIQTTEEREAERRNEPGLQLDAIIHMAGMYDLNSLVEMTEEEFLRIFQVNLFAMYRVNKTFLPILKEGSRIVITSSELAPLDPLPFTGIYGITKTAVEKYAYSLRMELQLLGISVIILRPGAIDTGLLTVSTRRLDDFVSGTQYYSCNAERFKSIVESVETKKIAPEKIADLAAKALTVEQPKYIYSINRNPMLLLMQLLPPRLRTWIIKKILS